MEIAIYGKGGIGKSTVSANISTALAMSGNRVLQIGCDPKHDSTRQLLHGEILPTVLDLLRTSEASLEDLHSILKENDCGVGCIEAGGPKPGVGCAGRGIISAFELLEKHHVKDGYDTILYDVLGDVVCGGFAVPVRREYAEAVYLVTSGEYMALYAANNILRGIRNFDGDKYCRVAGIIYNERRLDNEDARVRAFADAVGLPICIKVPRSEAFARAEEQKKTVMEMQKEQAEKEQQVFQRLAAQIIEGPQLYKAEPLSDLELENIVFAASAGENGAKHIQAENLANSSETAEILPETEVQKAAAEENARQRTEIKDRKPASQRLPLYGCAFNGAATAAVNLTDAVIVAHSPRACAFYTWQTISSPGRKNLFRRGILMPSSVSPGLMCSEISDEDVVFGGLQHLRETVEKALDRIPGAIIIISSCVSGIIGDDIRQMEELSTEDTPILTIDADGVLAGDYMEGLRLCLHTLGSRLIDRRVKPEGRKINLIGETGVALNREINFRIVKAWMEEMNIEIGCRFLGETTSQKVREMLSAPLNILASDSADGRDLQKWLQEEYDCRFMEHPLPIGAAASVQWIQELGAFFGVPEKSEKLIHGQLETYRERIAGLKAVFEGKRMMITTININLDWLLDTLEDVGVEVVHIGVMNYLHQEVKVSDHPGRYRIDSDFNVQTTDELVKELHPDIVLSNYVSPSEDGSYITDAIPMSPEIGFTSAVSLLERWENLLLKNRKGDWVHDRALFEHYYA